MKRILIAAVAACALALAATAGAALQPGIYDPNNTGCVTSTYSNGVLHLAKKCVSSTNASAGANITGFTGQKLQTASFTLASASQCQGGSPRFNVYTTGGTFFLGCNNVTPTINADGTATYTFTAANLQPQVAGTTPGTITTAGVVILIDQQGTADITKISVNGAPQVPVAQAPTAKSQCRHGGWKHFTGPTFKNQGRCISYWNHLLHATTHAAKTKHSHHHHG